MNIKIITHENFEQFRKQLEQDTSLSDEFKSLILDDIIESLEEQILRGEISNG